MRAWMCNRKAKQSKESSYPMCVAVHVCECVDMCVFVCIYLRLMTCLICACKHLEDVSETSL